MFDRQLHVAYKKIFRIQYILQQSIKIVRFQIENLKNKRIFLDQIRIIVKKLTIVEISIDSKLDCLALNFKNIISNVDRKKNYIVAIDIVELYKLFYKRQSKKQKIKKLSLLDKNKNKSIELESENKKKSVENTIIIEKIANIKNKFNSIDKTNAIEN